MFKETLKRKQKSVAMNIIILILVILVIVAVQVSVSYLLRSFNISSLEYLLFLLLIAGAAAVFIKNMVSYGYTIIDSDIIFEKGVGSRARCVECIKMNEILQMGKNLKEDYKNIKKRRFSVKNTRSDVYFIVYKRDEKIYSAMFHPTQKFIGLMEKQFKAYKDTNGVKDKQ